ncbi:MAG: hypothetical protein GF355_06070 [Candidatus Eisenbacteria bacterium]|nr:hypothetical protein [Candidatus Eisenbacteria bacterium]
MLEWAELGTYALRLVGASVLGGIIGFERERERKPAGLRTHMLVASGCCLIMLISGRAPDLFDSRLADPTRIAAQIVTGIGFLGAGSIIQARGAVYGLTTAASIWMVAAIGMAIGAGFYGGALTGTALAWLILAILDRWETVIARKGRVLTLSMTLRNHQLGQQVQKSLEAAEVKIIESHLRQEEGRWRLSYRAVFAPSAIQRIYRDFGGAEGVEEIRFGS